MSSRTLCHNCRFDVTMIELKKINNKCPRCGSGMFNKFIKEEEKIPGDTGDGQQVDVRGKPLAS